MTEFAAVEWERASRALAAADQIVETDPDSAASRAYYAAFHAVTAVFGLRGQSFSKHTALRAAVHRELVRDEGWPTELGRWFDLLLAYRETGDYGGLVRVSAENARCAVGTARQVLEAVRQACPEVGQLNR